MDIYILLDNKKYFVKNLITNNVIGEFINLNLAISFCQFKNYKINKVINKRNLTILSLDQIENIEQKIYEGGVNQNSNIKKNSKVNADLNHEGAIIRNSNFSNFFKKMAIVLLCLLLLGIMGFGGYLAYNYFSNQHKNGPKPGTDIGQVINQQDFQKYITNNEPKSEKTPYDFDEAIKNLANKYLKDEIKDPEIDVNMIKVNLDNANKEKTIVSLVGQNKYSGIISASYDLNPKTKLKDLAASVSISDAETEDEAIDIAWNQISKAFDYEYNLNMQKYIDIKVRVLDQFKDNTYKHQAVLVISNKNNSKRFDTDESTTNKFGLFKLKEIDREKVLNELVNAINDEKDPNKAIEIINKLVSKVEGVDGYEVIDQNDGILTVFIKNNEDYLPTETIDVEVNVLYILVDNKNIVVQETFEANVIIQNINELKDVSISSENDKIATAILKDDKITISGIKKGTTAIIVTATNTNNKTTVTVVVTEGGKIKVDKDDLEVSEGSNENITIINFNDLEDVNAKIDDESIATYDMSKDTITINGLKKGTTTLTLSASNAVEDKKIVIKVIDKIDIITDGNVKVNKKEEVPLVIGNIDKLKNLKIEENDGNQYLEIKQTEGSIKLVGLEVGDTKITLSADNANNKVISVKVLKERQDVSLEETKFKAKPGRNMSTNIQAISTNDLGDITWDKVDGDDIIEKVVYGSGGDTSKLFIWTKKGIEGEVNIKVHFEFGKQDIMVFVATQNPVSMIVKDQAGFEYESDDTTEGLQVGIKKEFYIQNFEYFDLSEDSFQLYIPSNDIIIEIFDDFSGFSVTLLNKNAIGTVHILSTFVNDSSFSLNIKGI